MKDEGQLTIKNKSIFKMKKKKTKKGQKTKLKKKKQMHLQLKCYYDQNSLLVFIYISKVLVLNIQIVRFYAIISREKTIYFERSSIAWCVSAIRIEEKVTQFTHGLKIQGVNAA